MLHSENLERKVSESEQKDEIYNIFINNVDSFNGKYILSSLHKQGFEELTLSHKDVVVEEDGSTENKNVESDKIEAFETNETAEADEDKSLTFDQIISATSKGPRLHSKYKIFGSLITPSKQKPEGIFEITAENNEQFKNIITNCDCIIYDISTDEYQIAKALTALSIIEQDIERHKGSGSKHSCTPMLFILISTCMTWALTARMDPTDPDPIPFVESDYRRRKPHPNYKEHYDCEREVMQKGRKFKAKLRTMVVCSGVTYGFEEHVLAFLFKKAWCNDQYLPVFGNGTNFVPLIHVADLAQMICKLIEKPPLKNQYILAVEQTPTCLKYIVKNISRALGRGKIEYVFSEEAYLYSEIDHHIFDCLTANIVMEPEFIITPLEIVWKSEMNFVENIETIVEEFKSHRNLASLKIFVHGPPCSGKTKLAHLICEHYNLHYVSVKSILDPSELKIVNFSLHQPHFTCKSKSKTVVKECDKFNMDSQDLEDLIDSEDINDFLNFYKEDSEEENYQKNVADENKKFMPKDLTENMRLSDEQVAFLLRREMFQNHSQNIGFVLDGYPKTSKQAAWLFRNENYRFSTNSDEIAGFNSKSDNRLIPNYVIDLDASNSFLFDRISRKPEESIQNTHYNERDMVRRLMAYRDCNKGETGLMNYFHNYQTDIVEINVSEFPSEDFKCIFYICTKIIGPPRGFGPTHTEITELTVLNEHQEKLQHEKEELQKQLQIERHKKDVDEKMIKLLEKYHHENVRLERILGPKVEKYRLFTAKKVIPILFQALMIVAEKKPRNSLDFLAEYLFKNNPNGKMYNSRYTRNGEEIIETNL